jgi:hypothetical protein
MVILHINLYDICMYIVQNHIIVQIAGIGIHMHMKYICYMHVIQMTYLSTCIKYPQYVHDKLYVIYIIYHVTHA